MRIHFASAERPKSVARKLRKLFKERGEPISQHRSLEIVASLYGYRDWQELSASIGSHAPSPDDHVALPEVVAARREAQIEALARHGLNRRDAAAFLERLATASVAPGHLHPDRILDSLLERASMSGVSGIDIESRRGDYVVRFVTASGDVVARSGSSEECAGLLRMVEERAFETHRESILPPEHRFYFHVDERTAYRLTSAKLRNGKGDDVEIKVIHADPIPGLGADDESLRGEPEFDLVDSILRRALRVGASDIHIEPRAGSYSIHFRVIGQRSLVHSGPPEEYTEILTALKRRSGIDPDVDRVGQDGAFKIAHEGERIDLRVATIPSSDGELIVLKVLDPRRVRPSLADLGIVKATSGSTLASFGDAVDKSDPSRVVTAMEASRVVSAYRGEPLPATWATPVIPAALLDLVMDVYTLIGSGSVLAYADIDGTRKLGLGKTSVDLTDEEFLAMTVFVDDRGWSQMTRVTRSDGALTLRVQWARDLQGLGFTPVMRRDYEWTVDPTRLEAILARNPSPSMSDILHGDMDEKTGISLSR